ncbi:MAG: hypothetical protein AAF658_15030, partial [Myxococcota bacterium]
MRKALLLCFALAGCDAGRLEAPVDVSLSDGDAELSLELEVPEELGALVEVFSGNRVAAERAIEQSGTQTFALDPGAYEVRVTPTTRGAFASQCAPDERVFELNGGSITIVL